MLHLVTSRPSGVLHELKQRAGQRFRARELTRLLSVLAIDRCLDPNLFAVTADENTVTVVDRTRILVGEARDNFLPIALLRDGDRPHTNPISTNNVGAVWLATCCEVAGFPKYKQSRAYRAVNSNQMQEWNRRTWS